MEDSIEEDIKILEEFIKYYEAEATSRKFRGTLSIRVDEDDIDALENLINIYKRVLKENETYKKQYFGLIDKIENKIDKFDYEFEKAKRKNYRERADYYWDLIINLKKLLESEE